ncbi:MAG: hypothetical protein QXJ21_07300 [Thermofilum sp.]
MDVRNIIAAVALIAAAASLLVTAPLLTRMAEPTRKLDELSGTLKEVEKAQQQLQERLRSLEEALSREAAGASARCAASSEVRAIVYILPSRACSPEWRERYGDRIQFYVHANLTAYRSYVEEDFRAVALVYNTVIIVVPADDTELYYSNLKLLDQIAAQHRLKIMWAIFPEWKYGAEQEYLVPGTPMNKLVLSVMDFLSQLNSTWRIAVWYGWSDRMAADDVLSFYSSLPSRLKPFYAAWLDDSFIGVAVDLAAENPPFLVVTELYSEDELSAYSNLLPCQMVVTGYEGARTPEEWLEGISRELQLVRGADRAIGIWIFYDINDGHGEEYAAFRPEWGAIPDPFRMQVVSLSDP